MRKTKIVCTLGPSTDKEGVLEELVLNGMDVARFNFSHSTYKEHEFRLRKLEKIREEFNRPVAALMDTKGPEVRVKKFRDGKAYVETGQIFTLTSKDIEGSSEGVSITYNNLVHDVMIGNRILIDDGLIEMIVVDVNNTDVVCKVVNGGVISDRKGVNIPDVALSMPYVSKQDKQDITFAIEQGFDFIAASFVRCASDVLQIRTILEEAGHNEIKIISKIENAQGVRNIDEIIEVSDGVMVARGDMGVEISQEEVPIVQKFIINKVYKAGKQVITATQMLDSMIKNPRPTRAETADVANAIYDGTSAVMLSGETAAGQYPVEALKTMDKIAVRIEEDIDYKRKFSLLSWKSNPDITDAISHATCTTAHDLNARAIVTVTKSGLSARMISRYRPQCDIVACATTKLACRQLNLSWGLIPTLIDEEENVFDLFEHAIRKAEDKNLIYKGDIVVLTGGVPLGISGKTNMIKVSVV